MSRKLFGTDGVRGIAGSPPLDPATVFALGRAVGRWASADAEAHLEGARPSVLIGADPRESSDWIAGFLAAGLEREGVEVRFAGIIPTPGVACLTRKLPFAAGVMISASHNPFQDNGIKVFSHAGYKLPDEVEQRLEEEVFRLLPGSSPNSVKVAPEPELVRQYEEHVISTVAYPLDGMDLVVDCANGAAFQVAPKVFARLGACVQPVGCCPNGRNINQDCGSLHLDALRRRVAESDNAIGIAFDGDADRVILVSPAGRTIDGDHILFIAATSLHAAGLLNARDGQPLVVATVMSNLGLERALQEQGIRIVRSKVGDRYVLEEMLRTGAVLGGEQSGHVIFAHHSTTGDGLLTALQVLGVAVKSGATLDDLTRSFIVYPQKLVNVPVKRRQPLEDIPSVALAVREAERTMGAEGRVVVRFSGTEPVARVMVEALRPEHVERFTQRIAAAILSALA